MVFLKIVNYTTPYKNNKKKTNVKYKINKFYLKIEIKY